VATKGLGIEAASGSKGSDEVPEVGVRHPGVLCKGKKGRILFGGKNGEEAAESCDGAENGPRNVRDRNFDGRAIELRSFGEAEVKDRTPLTKTDIATRKVGTGFPSSFKLRNQISGSKHGEETHTESCPEGKDSWGMEVGEGPKTDQQRDGEVGLRFRTLACSPNSFEAKSQSRIGPSAHGNLDPDGNVQ
jgi:hypothetical protein